MKTPIEWLRGKKAYLVAAVAAIYGIGMQAGWWPHSVAVDGVLAALGVTTLRAGIAKAVAPVLAALLMTLPAQAELQFGPVRIQGALALEVENPSNPIEWLDEIVGHTEVFGAYAWILDGDSGQCVPIQYTLTWIDLGSRTNPWVRINLGPAYIPVITDLGELKVRHCVGVSVCTQVLRARDIDDWFHRIPVLGHLPVDLSQSQFQFAFGAEAAPGDGKIQDHLLIEAGLTIGLGRRVP